MDYSLLINGVNWGYNPLPNLLLTSWDIQVYQIVGDFKVIEHDDYFQSSKESHQLQSRKGEFAAVFWWMEP